jgi:hypothetical protein
MYIGRSDAARSAINIRTPKKNLREEFFYFGKKKSFAGTLEGIL